MSELLFDASQRRLFDAWVDETRARFVPPLTTAEVRKGVQALSWNYVEERVRGKDAARALHGEGKRAAFASYFAPLHFLTACLALRTIGAQNFAPIRTIHDAACGTGAVGAALATSQAERPRVLGFDVSPWAVGEAKRTYDHFLLDARATRGALPGDLPRAGAGHLFAFGWAANELDEETRTGTLKSIIAALRRGASLIVIEPVSGRITPWWDAWCARLEPLGAQSVIVRDEIELPEWIETLDDASGLRHDELVAKVLWRL